MSGFSYRPYQIEAQQAVRLAWESGIEGGLHPMIVLPTGCGKTATALDFAAETLQAGGRVVWGAHRTELLTQPLKAFCRAWPELGKYAGIVQGSRDDASCRFVAASFDTLRNKKRLERLLSFGPIDLLIVDEGHHAAAETYLRVIRAMKAGRMVGLTATPHRDDGKALEEVWDIVYSYPVTEAIGAGFLVPPYSMVLPIPGVDAKILAIADDEAQGDALIAAHVVEHTVAAIQGSGLAVGLPARDDSRFFDASKRRYFLFSASVKQAELTAAALREAGIAAAAASGETPADVRAGMLADLTKGRITVLCSPMIFTEGTDCPAVDGVVIARSCSGWATYVQCVGRGLRPNPETGKRDCLILDFSGASEAHDLRSAPVLIGGSKCPEAANGVHVFEEDKRGRAVCALCQKTLPCFAAKGPHAWGVDHICRACGKPQCEGTTDHAHSWIRAVDVQICTACGAETKIRTAMVPKLSTKPTPAAFVRIPDLSEEFWAFRAGESGTVAVECDRATKKGRAFWFVERGRVGRPITPGWVEFGLIRAYLEDIAKRAEKLIRPDAEWRQRPISRNMMTTLDFHGIQRDRRWNMGQAFDAVARVTIRDKLIKAGLAHDGREARHDEPPEIVPGKGGADARE